MMEKGKFVKVMDSTDKHYLNKGIITEIAGTKVWVRFPLSNGVYQARQLKVVE